MRTAIVHAAAVVCAPVTRWMQVAQRARERVANIYNYTSFQIHGASRWVVGGGGCVRDIVDEVVVR